MRSSPGLFALARHVLTSVSCLLSSQANTFQCILGISSSTTYIFFQYADGLMSWGGGPSPALVGFNAGDGTSSLELPTSRTDSVLDIASTGNTGRDGRWLFVISGSEVTFPGKENMVK